MGTLIRSNRLAGLTVGVYGSGGAPWHHLAFVAAHGGQPRVVRAEDVAAGRLDELDVLIMPGGGAAAMAGLTMPLGETGATAVRDWVEAGGTYLSSCAGSVLPLALSEEASGFIPHSRCLRMVEAPLANTGDATLGGLTSPGVGRITVRLDPGHRFTDGLPERVDLIHYNGPLFDMAAAASSVEAFAWPEGATAEFTPSEMFLASSPAGAGHEGTMLERCVARGAATGLEASYGQGRAILFGSHPEFGLGPLCLGWGEGAGLLLNALSDAGRMEHRDETDAHPWPVERATDASASELAGRVANELRNVSQRFAALAERDPKGWLQEGFAPAFHGRPARSAWAADTAAAATAAKRAAAGLEAIAGQLDDADVAWLDDEPRAGQDFGAMGLSQMLRLIQSQLDEAERAVQEPPRRPAHAYDLFDLHPFHLAMGSYLSAAGLTAAALLVVALLHYQRGSSDAGIDELLWLD